MDPPLENDAHSCLNVITGDDLFNWKTFFNAQNENFWAEGAIETAPVSY